jgi:hypothetical protein
MKHKKKEHFRTPFVDPLGLEPRLFGTKNRRVASYTMGHSDMLIAKQVQN